MDPARSLPLELVRCNPQIRRSFSATSIAELAQSITTCGQIQPILVRAVDAAFDVIDGERRVRAMILLGRKTIDAIVRGQDDVADLPIACTQLVANAQREDLNPIEQALAFKEIMQQAGWSAAQTAERLGFSPAVVSRALALLKLDPAIQASVANATIPASAGYELSKITDPVKQKELTQQLLGGTITRDGLSGVVKAAKRKQNDSPHPVTPQDRPSRITAAIDANTSVVLAGANLTVERAIEISEELLARLRKVRQQGISMHTALAMWRDQAKP